MRAAIAFVVLLAGSGVGQAAEPAAWPTEMKAVHAKFAGKPGTLALFGDSITLSKAFWAPLAHPPRSLPERVQGDLELVSKHMVADCWSNWRGARFGNESGMTTKWAEDNVDDWLKRLDPETVVLMFGTNDLVHIEEKEYAARTRAVVDRCLKNGSVVILTTIPPRAGREKKAAAFAQLQRDIAAERKLPLVDFHAEILKRRPNDWNGALPQFQEAAAKDGYQVPTLIAADGVHPSYPSRHQDYSSESLDRNGYQLRTVLTMAVYAEVIRAVLQ